MLVSIAKVHARDEAQGVSLLDCVTVLPAAARRGRRAGRLTRGRAVTGGRGRGTGRRAAAAAGAGLGAGLAGARLGAGLAGARLGARLGTGLGAAGLLGSKLVQET